MSEIIIKNIKVLLDAEDIVKVAAHSWYLEKSNSKYYFRTRINNKLIRLHRFIISAKSGEQVDHINGNPFDNRKQNLRICKPNENSRNMKMHKDNKCGYKGVCYSKNKYVANIYVNGKNKYLGRFRTAKEAAEIYNKVALELFGEFAKLNEI